MVPGHRYSADREVREKSADKIERETARRWAARATACYARSRGEGGVRWLLRAEDYRHEALEHAALAEDGGCLVGEIERELRAVRPKGDFK